jgi:hypothetical protein
VRPARADFLFALGYFGAIFLVFSDKTNHLTILVGAIFMYEALFVFLVVRNGWLTIEELLQGHDRISHARDQSQIGAGQIRPDSRPGLAHAG